MLSIPAKKTLRQAPGLAAKYKVILALKLFVPIGAIAFSSEQESPYRRIRCACKLGQIFPVADIDLIPIVHPRAMEVAIVDRKAEWLDQVQPAAGRKAKTRNVPRIWWNFRLD